MNFDLTHIISGAIAILGSITIAFIGRRKRGKPVFYSDDFEKLSEANRDFRRDILTELKMTKKENLSLLNEIKKIRSENESLIEENKCLKIKLESYNNDKSDRKN